MKDQDEIYEAATEEPATLGCPSLVPGTVVVHDEPGDAEKLAELQRKGEKLKASNDRMYAKMVRIAELANECVLKTTHAEYAPGQYGQDYREFGKTMGEIRELVGKSLVELAQKTQLKPLVKRCAKTPETIVMQTTLPSGRCLSAEWLNESTDHRTQGFLYDDDKIVCEITFYDCYQSRNIGFRITKQALRGLVSRAGHMGRYRANKKEKKGGAK